MAPALTLDFLACSSYLTDSFLFDIIVFEVSCFVSVVGAHSFLRAAFDMDASD